MAGCEYIGPEQTQAPFEMCGKTSVEGKSYCHEHYYVVYKKGTSVNGKRREKEVEKEIADLNRQQEIEEIENA